VPPSGARSPRGRGRRFDTRFGRHDEARRQEGLDAEAHAAHLVFSVDGHHACAPGARRCVGLGDEVDVKDPLSEVGGHFEGAQGPSVGALERDPQRRGCDGSLGRPRDAREVHRVPRTVQLALGVHEDVGHGRRSPAVRELLRHAPLTLAHTDVPEVVVVLDQDDVRASVGRGRRHGELGVSVGVRPRGDEELVGDGQRRHRGALDGLTRADGPHPHVVPARVRLHRRGEVRDLHCGVFTDPVVLR
jgi:hypothetical protein